MPGQCISDVDDNTKTPKIVSIIILTVQTRCEIIIVNN